MTNSLCLRCDNYQFKDTPFIDGRIQHPRLNWECIKGMFPIDCEDENGNVVTEYCQEYKMRG